MAVTTAPAGAVLAEEHRVSYALKDGVAVIELRRPSAGNALDVCLRHGLLAALRRVRDDGAAVRAVLLSARGKHFCVSQDLKEHAGALAGSPASSFETVRAEYNPLVEGLHALRQPVVVAVEGACAGAGLGLALCADVRVAAQSARSSTAFIGIGLAADSGLSATLARAVGPSRAAALILLGDRFDAEAAQQWGLVHRVVPDGGAHGVLPRAPLPRTRRSRPCRGTLRARSCRMSWPVRRRHRSISAGRRTTAWP
jgi:2-(1,2-epoxy-1,2-dihydrophenyl)acetyl-CoA isomerase